jgi:hypothetical protein
VRVGWEGLCPGLCTGGWCNARFDARGSTRAAFGNLQKKKNSSKIPKKKPCTLPKSSRLFGSEGRLFAISSKRSCMTSSSRASALERAAETHRNARTHLTTSYSKRLRLAVLSFRVQRVSRRADPVAAARRHFRVRSGSERRKNKETHVPVVLPHTHA